jgi:alpha-beta hydrolase superfamily lysophospholipase
MSTSPPKAEVDMADTAAPSIVLIHGLWVTALSWEHWIQRYTEMGYHVIARGWPGMEDVTVEELRRDPSRLAGLGLTQIVDHFDGIVRTQEKPPILIGHSFGGLITQILLDRGLGAAGVAIDPAPAKGLLVLPMSSLRVAFPVLRNPFGVNKTHEETPEEFHYAFTNTLTDEEARLAYERYEVPGPNRVLFEDAFASFTRHSPAAVNYGNHNRAPLLMIAGGKDHIAPASMTRATYELYLKAETKAVTDFKEYPERSHFTIGAVGWEDVADFALHWAVKHAAAYTAKRPGTGPAASARAIEPDTSATRPSHIP